MIITVGSLKGGVGKSTVAVNLAVAMTTAGRSTLLVDADPIGTTTRWLSDREQNSPEATQLLGVAKRGALHSTIRALSDNYDTVIVDTGGFDSPEVRTAGSASDIFLTPMKPSPLDLDTLPGFISIIEEMKDITPELKVLGVFTQTSTHPADYRLGEAQKILTDWPEVTVLETKIHQRSAFMDTMPLGLSVTEWSDAKAKAEIQELTQEVLFNAR